MEESPPKDIDTSAASSSKEKEEKKEEEGGHDDDDEDDDAKKRLRERSKKGHISPKERRERGKEMRGCREIQRQSVMPPR